MRPVIIWPPSCGVTRPLFCPVLASRKCGAAAAASEPGPWLSCTSIGDSGPGPAAAEAEEDGCAGEAGRAGGWAGLAAPGDLVTRLQLMLPGLRLTWRTSCWPATRGR